MVLHRMPLQFHVTYVSAKLYLLFELKYCERLLLNSDAAKQQVRYFLLRFRKKATHRLFVHWRCLVDALEHSKKSQHACPQWVMLDITLTASLLVHFGLFSHWL